MTIGDIAKMANVSRAAVSRYLNKGYVSEEKRERIRKVIEETGYQPSVLARTLRTKKTKLIGVILPRINSDSISGIVEGIGAVLQEAHYNMLLAATENRPDRELDFLRIFANNRVDGIILIATVFTGEHERILSEMQIPVVIVGQKLTGFTSIFHDDYGAGLALTQHLLETGRREIGFIRALPEDVAVGQQRFKGYRDAMEASGIAVRDEMYTVADFSVSSGYEKFSGLIRTYPEMDAVICATDRIALGAINYMKEHGLSVPENIAAAGFGDNVITAYTTPPITTVHLHYRESGEVAADRMLKLLSGDTSPAEHEICLGFELVLRGSG